jgi:hypothetical protein
MTEHTPGPWTEQDGEIIAQGAVIAVVYGADDYPCADEAVELRQLAAECKANARLIIAAPDLLTACEAVMRLVDAGECSDGYTADQARAAIAKARASEAQDG